MPSLPCHCTRDFPSYFFNFIGRVAHECHNVLSFKRSSSCQLIDAWAQLHPHLHMSTKIPLKTQVTPVQPSLFRKRSPVPDGRKLILNWLRLYIQLWNVSVNLLQTNMDWKDQRLPHVKDCGEFMYADFTKSSV